MSTADMSNLNVGTFLATGPVSAAELDQHIVERFRLADGADQAPSFALSEPYDWPLSRALRRYEGRPFPTFVVAAVVVAMLAVLAVAGSLT